MYECLPIHDAKSEGRKEGRKEQAIEAVRAFFENGVSIELIAKSMKMTEEQVKEIVSTHAKEAVTV